MVLRKYVYGSLGQYNIPGIRGEKRIASKQNLKQFNLLVSELWHAGPVIKSALHLD